MRLREKFYLLPIVRGFVAAVIFAAVLSTFAADSTTTYANWVKPWLERPVTSPALAGAGLKLVVSRVQGEADATTVTAMSAVERAQLAYRIKVAAAEVTTNGNLRTYFISNTDARSSAVRSLAAGDLALLDPLLTQLPDDRAQLPPAGERIVVQFLNADGQWRVRVYDGKNLPLEVKDLLALLAKPYDKLF
jgi:hypothetical protein